MKAVLDIHDFSVVYPRMDLLLKLKNHFPNFKVSLFTIPFNEKKDWGPSLLRKDNLKEIKSNLDWMQIIPHGFVHDGSEMRKMTYDQFALTSLLIQDAFDDDGLPYEKGFCSPHWRQSEGVTEVLNTIGWWGAVLREGKETPNRFYRYDFLANEPFWESDKEVLKIHSHLYGTKNDLGRCFPNLLKLPRDTEWHYVTDYLETK